MRKGAPLILLLVALYLSLNLSVGAERFAVAIRPAGSDVELSWPSSLTDPQLGALHPEYEVQVSQDLVHWRVAATNLRGTGGAGEQFLKMRVTVDAPEAPAFYRVMAKLPLMASETSGSGGEEVFGYAAQMREELSLLGSMSLDAFVSNAVSTVYLPQLTWDPAGATYATNVAAWLSPRASAILRTNGFAVVAYGASFAGIYYSVFESDLPVFVTADSVLHAWHMSYSKMLKQIEEGDLYWRLGALLNGMSGQVSNVWQQFGSGPLRDSILDADYFLAVAKSLQSGAPAQCVIPLESQGKRVADALSAVSSLALQSLALFGSDRTIDFSQFKVRGHYATSELLQNYFRAMMWCGRIDFRIASFPPNAEDDIRQLGTMLVLQQLLEKSAQFDKWEGIERVTTVFVGNTDSLTFGSTSNLFSSAGIFSLADVPDRATLTNLQTLLLTTDVGYQNVRSDFFWSPLDAPLKLPRSFTVCGQKFVLDSWALSQMVYDRAPLMRRKPSCLDVAYSVLGNQQAAPELAARMSDPSGVRYRDGVQYQANLEAVRRIVDRHTPQYWTNCIYSCWLTALRELSGPTTNPQYPEAMRTRAWAMKTLNTQMGSWTELRHDTVLYVKQSYTDPVLCGYPYGFVEPRPEFWRAMRVLAESTAQGVRKARVALGADADNYLRNFASTMTTLEGIAAKELAQEPLSLAESAFLQNVVEIYTGYMGQKLWTGWYPQLFYGPQSTDPGVLKDWEDPNMIVADVHTDLPDDVTGDPGAIVHQGTRGARMMVVAIDNGPDRMIYAGPVFTHYEFEMPAGVRLSDAEWQSYPAPPPPSWTECYQ